MIGLLTRTVRRLALLCGRPVSYEGAKELVRDRDTKLRRRLAVRTDMRPEILYFLAEDPVAEVRREIASNARTPAQANLLLARDRDDDVRCDLAAKISRLVPQLGPDERDKIRRLTIEALEILARDEITRVRQIIAETLKDVANAPPSVIRRLSRDAELKVAAPVLEFSPLLTDEDLIDIIRSGPIEGALTAISRREDVPAPVADAIAARDDVGATAALLANPSAQIREETLDRIIDRAPEVEPWHGPLVYRPRLSASAVRRIALFVADNLLEVLQRRADLDPETARHVADLVRERIDKEAAADNRLPIDEPDEPAPAAVGDRNPNAALKRAKKLHAKGKLDEQAVSDAVAAGDRAFVAAALGLLAGVSSDLVSKIFSSRSAKGVTAVAWKAGMSMRLAIQLQGRLAGIAPNALLNARNGVDYPLSDEEMNWQIEFFAG